MSKSLEEYKEKTMCNISKIIRHYIDENKEIPKEFLKIIDFNEMVNIEAYLEHGTYKGVYKFHETIATNLVRTLDVKYYKNFIQEDWILSANETGDTSSIASQLLLNNDFETLRILNKKMVEKVLKSNDYKLENSFTRFYLKLVLDIERVDGILSIDKRNKSRVEYFEFFKEVLDGAEKIYEKQKSQYFNAKTTKKMRTLNWANNWFGESDSIGSYIGKYKINFMSPLLSNTNMFLFFKDAMKQPNADILKDTDAFKYALMNENIKVINYYIENKIFDIETVKNAAYDQLKEKFKNIDNLFFSSVESKSRFDTTFITNLLKSIGEEKLEFNSHVFVLNLLVGNDLVLDKKDIDKFLNITIEKDDNILKVGDLLKSGDMLEKYFDTCGFELKVKSQKNESFLDSIAKYKEFNFMVFNKLKDFINKMPSDLQEEINKKLDERFSMDYFLSSCMQGDGEPYTNITKTVVQINEDNSVKKIDVVISIEEHQKNIKSFLATQVLDKRLVKKENDKKQVKI